MSIIKQTYFDQHGPVAGPQEREESGQRDYWLEHFAALVAAHERADEREACAKVCEHQPHWAACAAAIRARETK